MKNFAITFLVLYILISTGLTIKAQSAEKKVEMILPVLPLIAEYEYAPTYLSQEIKNHPQYEEIMAIFDPKDPSSVEVILIEKDTHKRVYYCNSKTNVLKRKMQSEEAILSKIDFKPSQSDDRLPIYGFGFLDKSEQPVLWRVIPTNTPSIRGAGINAVDGEAALRIEYRDLGTTIGEGTAVKIGDKVFEAEPWPAISSPPYFYAYHGSFTIGRHMGALRLGDEKWRVTSRPQKLNKGEKWVLTNELGYKRNLKIVSDHHNELVVEEINPPIANAPLHRLILHLTPQGYTMRALILNSATREMRIKFDPELPIQTSDPTDFEGTFKINQGTNKNVISGTITRKQEASRTVIFTWESKSSAWARSNPLETRIKFGPEEYSILTRGQATNPSIQTRN